MVQLRHNGELQRTDHAIMMGALETPRRLTGQNFMPSWADFHQALSIMEIEAWGILQQQYYIFQSKL
jgi:hypothetical protein